jgi:hypothetical protein
MRKQDDRPTVVSYNGWGTFNLPEDGLEFTNIRCEGGKRHIWSSFNESADLLDGVLLDNVLAYGTGELLWAMRLYNVTNMRIKDTVFRYVGDLEKGREGHCIYLNLLGDLTLDNVFCHTSLGQGLQLVYRPWETNVSPELIPTEKDIIINKSRFVNLGGGDRDSFAVSIFGTGHRITMSDVLVRETNQLPSWDNTRTGVKNRSRGGILIGAGDFGNRDAVFTAVHVLLKDSDRPAVQIEECDHLEWAGGHCIDSGDLGWDAKVEIRLGAKSGEISRVRGNWKIRYEAEPGKFDLVSPEPGGTFEWDRTRVEI